MRHALWLVLLMSSIASAQADFDKSIAPLLVKRCIGCHSGASPKGDLDLTRKASVFTGDKPLIVGSKPAESPFWQRIEADEMPPKNPLSTEEKQQLKDWIAAGAKWGTDPIETRPSADWWAFRALKKPSTPDGVHPVDHFINQELAARKLKPVSQADKPTLIRRLSFNLTGLPPTPEQVKRFLNDTRPDAYDRLVDEFLASPHYGERWARHWLDVVHYGETHGYDKDQPRPNAWPYRDYVIRAFNQDKPYAQFVQEQIAGDRLFPGSVDGFEALGFLAAGPWDLIGHAEVPETKIDGKIARHLDRDDFVANTIGSFLSLTVHCAQCHDHKFDPISQKEYYSLQAIFAAIDRADKAYDASPETAQKRQELQAKHKAAETKLARLTADARKLAGPALTQLDDLIAAANRPTKGPRPEYGYHSALSSNQSSTKWVQLDFGQSVTLKSVNLRACSDDFNNIGAGFGFPLRFKVELADEATFLKPILVADLTATDQVNPGLAVVSLKIQGLSGRFLRITATKLAPRLPTDFMLALAEVEAFDAKGTNLARTAKVSARDSIEAPPRWRQTNLVDGIYPTGKVPPEKLNVLVQQRDALLDQALSAPAKQERQTLDKELLQINEGIKKLPPQQRVYIGTVHTGSGTFIGTGSTGGKPRSIHLLPRGDVTKPGAEVSPGALAAIPAKITVDSQAPEAERRASLAKWLTHAENPLLWRSIANRVWQYHFGRGLVDTPNDFGRMGELPSHPQLLEFLAANLRDNGGSLKKLHKLILTSEAYRRSSESNAENARTDADNRYLWRQQRRKLEAEAVRDSVLFVSGKLNLQMGGPSFRDFVVEKPEHSPHYQYHLFDPEDPKGHRRTIYRFIVRSKPQPFLATLDCADPSFSVDKRNQTITPQQALALLNNKLALSMAKHFANRVEASAKNVDEQIQEAVRLALGREVRETELIVLKAHAMEHGLASMCRLIFNLNEFVFVD
jgi:hypothetical protein